MDKNKKTDDLFREKLENYKPEFTQEHWQLMKQVIENSRTTNMEMSDKKSLKLSLKILLCCLLPQV